MCPKINSYLCDDVFDQGVQWVKFPVHKQSPGVKVFELGVDPERARGPPDPGGVDKQASFHTPNQLLVDGLVGLARLLFAKFVEDVGLDG